ncbi:MAG: phosphoketolase family protein [Micromonosporaceae bacterium]
MATDVTRAPPLDADQLHLIDMWWRAANYLTAGQIYLLDNPLLAEPLLPAHIKPRLLGHWGTGPGLNLLYAHLNRVISERDLNAIFVTGPGHGGPAIVANTWLDGTYGELHPTVGQNLDGMRQLFRQFSFPGGIGSHVTPEVPGSIHEGGELGYSLAHAYGAVFDHPDLLAVCVVGDGEAETGPLSGSWASTAFLNPARDGAVLPVLHLNGYKIANPTVLARIPEADLVDMLRGHGYQPLIVDGEPAAGAADQDAEASTGPKDGADASGRIRAALAHQQLASALDAALDQIARIQRQARDGAAGRTQDSDRPRWPMIVLRTPKGWTGPRVVDGEQVEGTYRAHQVPLSEVRENPGHLAMLEQWLRSYRPEELFDPDGAPVAAIRAWPPRGERRMSANPIANGGELRPLRLPDFRRYAVSLPAPGAVTAEPTRKLGEWLRDVIDANRRQFRIFAPDEAKSNRLDPVFEVTGRAFDARRNPSDDHLDPDGRVMEVLSEHLCQGWLEGYLLTGRHGVFTSYEAFIHIVDSMFNQHAKWLKISGEVPWRRPVASLNYLLSSHVWRQDHNGFSHQDPGFIDHVVNKKAEIIRVYLPPDANTLLATMDHCLRSRQYVNVVVAGKQPAPQWLSMDDAVEHCRRGLDTWEWAGVGRDEAPDVVLGCAGDVPTLETLAAADLLRRHLPQLKVRVVNVVDLMRLQPPSMHPHGLPDQDFDAMFTTDKPVIFAYHGYPQLIHRLAYRRSNHRNLHVRGYIEEGTTTTPFDMLMMNQMDRFHLVLDVIDRTGLGSSQSGLRQRMTEERARCRAYTRQHGEDAPDIRDWTAEWAHSR